MTQDDNLSSVERDGTHANAPVRLNYRDETVIRVEHFGGVIAERLLRLEGLIEELGGLIRDAVVPPVYIQADEGGSVRTEITPEEVANAVASSDGGYSLAQLRRRAGSLMARAGRREAEPAPAPIDASALELLGVCDTWRNAIRARWGAAAPVFGQEFWLWSIDSRWAASDVREWTHRLPEPLFSNFFRNQSMVYRLHHFDDESEDGEKAIFARYMADWCVENSSLIYAAIGRAAIERAATQQANEAPRIANEPVHSRDAVALALNEEGAGVVTEASLRAARDYLA